MKIEYYITLSVLFAAVVIYLFVVLNKNKLYKKNLYKAKKDYLQYFSFLVMGAGSTEITRELCKIKHLWDTAENANDMSAALQLSDGVSALALQDAAERLNSDCLAEVEKTFRYKRNHLLWTIIRYSGLKNHSGKEKELLYSESIEKAKRMMSVRFCHYLKSYPRNWETDR